MDQAFVNVTIIMDASNEEQVHYVLNAINENLQTCSLEAQPQILTSNVESSDIRFSILGGDDEPDFESWTNSELAEFIAERNDMLEVETLQRWDRQDLLSTAKDIF